MPRRRGDAPSPQAGRAHYEYEVSRWAALHYPHLWGHGLPLSGDTAGLSASQRNARFLTKGDVEFRFWYRALEQQRRYERRGVADTRPGAILATALERFGYREARAPYAVGDTPKFRKRR